MQRALYKSSVIFVSHLHIHLKKKKNCFLLCTDKFEIICYQFALYFSFFHCEEIENKAKNMFFLTDFFSLNIVIQFPLSISAFNEL